MILRHPDRRGPKGRTVCVWLTLMVCLSPRAQAADLTFFAYSDIHYGAVNRDDGTSVVKSPMVDVINGLPGQAYPDELGGLIDTPRGVIMAGDLINDGAVAAKYPAQWADFVADFGVNGEGRCRFPVFEAVGNHDLNENGFVFDQVKQRNQVRLALGLIDSVSSNGYHYAWDWDGIRFVNVNLFPGNVWAGEADAYGKAHDPMGARDFLKEDLKTRVGSTGRPVMVVQHFRPIDDNWWTYAAADKVHRILQDYNVILIMNGHQGGGVNNLWRGINWASSNGELDVFRITPDNRLCVASRGLDRWRGTMQKKIYLSYESSGLPAVINNGDWVSHVTQDSAIVSGKILYEAVSPTEVTLFWGRADGGTNAEAWAHSKPIGVHQSGRVFSHEITGLAPWTEYYYRCRAANSQGHAWAAASIPFATRGVLAPGWETTFIGHEQRAWGGAHQDNGVFTVRGSGRDIGERGQGMDHFQYAHTTINGNGSITARIESMTGKNRDPKAGIMLRETQAKGARHLSLLLSQKGGLRLFCRSQAEGDTRVSDRHDMGDTPAWVRMERTDNLFTGYVSSDGITWTQAGLPVSMDMPPSVYAGLAVTAGNRDGSRLHTATFAEVSVTGATVRPVRDVTFLHISDPHYSGDSKGDMLAPTIQAMNDMRGAAYPPEIGGRVARPRGVILSGDLTHSATPEGWKKFVTQWGLTGTEGVSAYPVYEGAGNHDGVPSTALGDDTGYVRKQIIQRNASRVDVVNVSKNGLHYAWDWDDVHFVQLNEYAGAEDAERYPGNTAYGRKRQSYGNPAQESLQFLAQDLASQVGRSERPVILVQHYGLAGFPIHPWGDEAGWWTEEQALRLWEVMEGYNVITILGGHDGSENVFDWHGIPNRLMDDDVRFGVYHISDDRMTVAKRHAKAGTWEAHWTQSTTINASLPPDLVHGPYLIYTARPDEMTVCWRTHANVPCTLKWDDDQFFYRDGSVEVQPHDRDLHLYRHTITGLKPNSSVNYTLEIQGKYAPGMFYAAPLGSDRVKFLIATGQGDRENRDRLYRSLYETIYRDAAYHSILIHTGPMVSDPEDMRTWDQTLFSREPDAKHIRYVLSRLPIVCVPGSGTLEQQLFPIDDLGRGAYSFDYGPIHVALLNIGADGAAESDQWMWLKDDLASATTPWKFVVADVIDDVEFNEALPDALKKICRNQGVALCLWRGDAFRTAGQEAYVKINPADASEAWAAMAVQIEGNTLACDMMDLGGRVVDTLTWSHETD